MAFPSLSLLLFSPKDSSVGVCRKDPCWTLLLPVLLRTIILLLLFCASLEMTLVQPTGLCIPSALDMKGFSSCSSNIGKT
ncbi:hypothetical protein MRB53_036121 [Persea americana]|uniref:Uncharacterized protein n=1 Tax=Persea americana TaxID=3435 RepID=A0ACC2K6K4_PERAE|nr:hypothetical protein MRB53_036121 [Persea americana]